MGGMGGFFNQYLNDKTEQRKRKRLTDDDDRNIKSKERSRSRSRSRSRERNKTKEDTLNEEQRYHIAKYKEELTKKTFDESKRKQIEENALKKCSKRTTKSDVQSLRERYLKRKSMKK